MKSYFQAASAYLKRLQRSDDTVKKRWLVGASAVSMVLVISLWIVYTNSVFPSQKAAETASSTDQGFFATLKLGFTEIGKQFGNGWEKTKATLLQNLDALKLQFERSNSFTVPGTDTVPGTEIAPETPTQNETPQENQ